MKLTDQITDLQNRLNRIATLDAAPLLRQSPLSQGSIDTRGPDVRVHSLYTFGERDKQFLRADPDATYVDLKKALEKAVPRFLPELARDVGMTLKRDLIVSGFSVIPSTSRHIPTVTVVTSLRDR